MLVVLAWSMADGSRYAHETAAMGGVPFSAPVSSSAGTDSASEGRGADAAARLYAAAETYGLSPREVEVTALLLRGRSIPYICDELFIAKSTAQTHVRHIYAKMNITGRPPRAHRPHRGLRLVTVPAMPSAKSVSRTEQPLSQKPEYRV